MFYLVTLRPAITSVQFLLCSAIIIINCNSIKTYFLRNGAIVLLRDALYVSGVKAACACKTVHRVCNALSGKSHIFIAMPTDYEMRQSADEFFQRFGIPNIALGVDGTHITLGRRPLDSGK
jgi:hypothetical protein